MFGGMDLEKAVQTQIDNIQEKTGKSFDELAAMVRGCGKAKHGEIVAWLKSELGLGHGDANTLTHVVNKSHGAAQAEGKSNDAVLDEIYAGPKAGLRPIHEAFMAKLASFGEFEVAPKKGYVSLRRKKQFAMIGPATNSRVELGINIKGVPATERLLELPPGGMTQYKVKLTEASEVDDELMGWVRTAFDAAG